MQKRRDRLIERRVKGAGFRDRKTLDDFDWRFNSNIDRALILELATARFIEQREDCLILGNPAAESRISRRRSAWPRFMRASTHFIARRTGS
jgi:hypothetical protein